MGLDNYFTPATNNQELPNLFFKGVCGFIPPAFATIKCATHKLQQVYNLLFVNTSFTEHDTRYEVSQFLDETTITFDQYTFILTFPPLIETFDNDPDISYEIEQYPPMFRGKVYASLIKAVAGVDIYQDLDAKQVKLVSYALNNTPYDTTWGQGIYELSEDEANYIEDKASYGGLLGKVVTSLSKGNAKYVQTTFAVGHDEYKELGKMFKTFADMDCTLSADY
jgi:hypothetical protein